MSLKNNMKPYLHSKYSAKKYGGKPEDYMDLHLWLDQTKSHIADNRHRIFLHNSFGIQLLADKFGETRTNSDNKTYSVRDVGEDHILQDLGFIPSLDYCLKKVKLKSWMSGSKKINKKRFIIK